MHIDTSAAEANVDFTVENMPTPHACRNHVEEVEMSDCPAGCKVVRCYRCGDRYVEHRSVYGCQRGDVYTPAPPGPLPLTAPSPVWQAPGFKPRAGTSPDPGNPREAAMQDITISAHDQEAAVTAEAERPGGAYLPTLAADMSQALRWSGLDYSASDVQAVLPALLAMLTAHVNAEPVDIAGYVAEVLADGDDDPLLDERIYRTAETMESDASRQGCRIHVTIVNGWGDLVDGYGADATAVIEAASPEHGRRLAALIGGKPVTEPNADEPQAGEVPAWVDVRMLANDIADLIGRYEYPIDATADTIQAALPAFLTALAKPADADDQTETCADCEDGVVRYETDACGACKEVPGARHICRAERCPYGCWDRLHPGDVGSAQEAWHERQEDVRANDESACPSCGKRYSPVKTHDDGIRLYRCNCEYPAVFWREPGEQR